jgi:hypothetical protein
MLILLYNIYIYLLNKRALYIIIIVREDYNLLLRRELSIISLLIILIKEFYNIFTSK